MTTAVKRLGSVVAILSSLPGCLLLVDPVDELGCPLPVACDILDSDCQNYVFEVVACNRESSTVPPSVEVVDFGIWFDEQVDDPWVEDEEVWLRQQRGLALLHLAPTDADPAALVGGWAETVSAFYTVTAESVTILDRGYPLASDSAVVTLAHEFVHAQQDQEIDLEAYLDGQNTGLDGQLALLAMIEGEAELYESFAAVRLAGYSVFEIDWGAWHAHDVAWSRAQMTESDYVLTMAYRFFPYAFGMSVMEDAWSSSGHAEVERTRDDSPVSTRQVMAGYAASEPDQGLWLEDLTPVEAPQLGPEYTFILADTPGAFVLEAFGTRWGCDLVPIVRLRADRLCVAHDESVDNVVVSWRMRFARDLDRDAWLGCLLEIGRNTVASIDDGDLIVLASERSSVLEAADDIEWGPLPEETAAREPPWRRIVYETAPSL